MSLKGFMTSVILGLLLAIVSIWNFRIALYVLGIFYIIKGALQLINKEYYKKFQCIINVDRYKAYEKKNDEFKKYIKSDPISDLIMAFLFIYVGYKANIAAGSIKYPLMIFLFISIDYLIETNAMVKSEKWEDYKKKSIFTSIIMIFIVFFLLK
ncbi:hypothetical protein KQI89_09665 [Clostridium sp. MSJ-4]|uniref:Uncharacterized protein n=1 Tax=Clostridium simiarum TaxID=2841506 RepID=A0ABS6F0K4_9CLOT|nr:MULTISPECIES: hypothetical protein [Clostridium]MBU5592036.1 hypothetical protein [Clostridium simiarum]